MKQAWLLFTLVSIIGQAHGQSINFTKSYPLLPAAQIENPFEGVENGASALADINGDTLPDLLIMGRSNDFTYFSKLYVNNGLGNYTLLSNHTTTPLTNSALAFADVDNDGDQDLFCSGKDSNSLRKSELYLNNGSGIFSLAANTTFPAVDNGSIAFADVDGDNDQDLILTGQNNLNQFECALYKNNGSGSFTLDATTPFTGVRYSSIAFADVDADTDMDVMITGDIVSAGQNISNLYLNNGTGTFTLQPNSPFTAVEESAIAFLDFDNNQTLDLLITGEDLAQNEQAKLYANNGSGIFSLIDSTSFNPVRRGQVATADINNDGFEDLFISGTPSVGYNAAHLYFSNGDSTFTEASNIPMDGAQFGDAQLIDIDADSDVDLFLAGEKVGNIFNAKMYLNDSSGNFYQAGGHVFKGVYSGTLTAGDVDGDQDIDVFATGLDVHLNPTATLYLNNGAGIFSPSADTIFKATSTGTSVFADVDGDNDLDLMHTGRNSAGLGFAELYLNNGTGSFSLSTSSTFQGVQRSALAFADIDGDNDLDLFMSGRNLVNQRFTKLYTNNGSGTFSNVASVPFPNVENGSVAFADVDGDNDLDLFMTGQSGSNTYVANLYLNDSLGNFTLVTGQPFTGVRYGAMAFADVDGDTDMDIVYTGETSAQNECTIYLNNGSGNYTKDLNNSLTGLQLGTLNARDLEGDGDIDLIISGLNNNEKRQSLVYKNDSGNFTLQASILRGVYFSASVMAGFSGSQNQDLLVTGLNNSGQMLAYLYKNTPCYPVVITDSIVACNTYTWIDGNTYTSNDTNATFTISHIGTCDTLLKLNLAIKTVNTAVTRVKNKFTAQATNATYQWIDCSNNNIPITSATQALFEPNVNGGYAVVVSKNGCTDTSACFLVNDILLNEVSIPTDPTLFPNPTNGSVTIEFEQTATEITIDVYNTLGEKIIRKVNTGNKYSQINLPKAAGLYYISIAHDHYYKTFKVRKL